MRSPQIEKVSPHETVLCVVAVKWRPLKGYFFAGQQRGYKLVFSGNSGGWNYTLGSEVTSFHVGPLKKNTTYCVRVLAFDEYGDGPADECINITTQDGGW